MNEKTGFDTEQRDFGIVTITFRANAPKEMLAVGNRKVFEEGLIKLTGYVPLHAHTGGPLERPFAEDYTLRPAADNKAPDVRILICPVHAPIMSMAPEKIKELVKAAEPMVPGRKYHCPATSAHSIINLTGDSSSNVPIVETVKYYLG